MLKSALDLFIVAVLAGCHSQSTGKESVVGKSPDTGAPFTYHCENGQIVTAWYSSKEAATVEYKDDVYEMSLAVSASGARYVGEELEWWTKGIGVDSEGSVFRHTENGITGEALEQCKQASGKHWI